MFTRPTLNSVRGKTLKKYRHGTESDVNYLKNVAMWCQKSLTFFSLRTSVVALFYLMVILAVSLITDHWWRAPATYFSNKRNVFNVYFVKFGWGWTISFLAALITSTSYVRNCGNLYNVLINLMRLIFGTLWWYICVSLIEAVSTHIGFCSGKLSYRLSCPKADWKSLDISGHTFLLLFNILIILEEIKSFSDWDNIPSSCSTVLRNRGTKFVCDGATVEKARNIFYKFSWLVYIFITLVTALFYVWNFMIVSTLLYFHDTLQKVLGAFLAVVGWFAIYKYLYTLKSPFFKLPTKCGLY